MIDAYNELQKVHKILANIDLSKGIPYEVKIYIAGLAYHTEACLLIFDKAIAGHPVFHRLPYISEWLLKETVVKMGGTYDDPRTEPLKKFFASKANKQKKGGKV